MTLVLPENGQFKYLGMLLDRRMNLKIAEEPAVRPYMAAQSRISEIAKSHDLKSRTHAMLWLSKVYGAYSWLLGCMRVRCGAQCF